MMLLTTGKIAAELGIDRDKVCYAVRKLRITPVGTAGMAKVYPDNALPKVKDFLNSNERRGKRVKRKMG